MIVGAFEKVSDGIERSDGFEEVDDDELDALTNWDPLDVVIVEKAIVMSVVDSAADSDWKPADAAKPEEDEGTVVGNTTELVLLSVKNEIDVAVVVDSEETVSLSVTDAT